MGTKVLRLLSYEEDVIIHFYRFFNFRQKPATLNEIKLYLAILPAPQAQHLFKNEEATLYTRKKQIRVSKQVYRTTTLASTFWTVETLAL